MESVSRKNTSQENLTDEKDAVLRDEHTSSGSIDSNPHKSDLESELFLEKSFGVRKEEILIAQMTKRWQLAIFYFSIFIGMFTSLFESACISVFIGYATNSYKQHSLLSTVTLIRAVVAASSLPGYARVSDLFGRFEIFVFSLVFRVVGHIIMSQATDINRYAVGIVFYGFGYAGTRILWQINLADSSSLRYRFWATAVIVSPAIITTWASATVVQDILKDRGWSFGIALWAFTFPLANVPYVAMNLFMRFKARQTDEWKQLIIDQRASFLGMNEATKKHEDAVLSGGNKIWGRIKISLIRFKFIAVALFWQADIVACLFIIVICGFILVPLTLAGGVHAKWTRASTIVPLVIGFVAIPFFILWEAKISRHPLISFTLLKDRGIWAGFAIAVLYTFSTEIPGTYTYTILLVGMNATAEVATRITNLQEFSLAITILICGVFLAYVRKAKLILLGGIAVFFVGLGLFVHFRGDNNGVEGQYYRNGLAACICLIGVGSVFLSRLTAVLLQACTNHEYTALIIALFASLYTIGGALGRTVSGAIWTQTMYPTIVSKMKQLDVDTSLAALAFKAPYTFIEKYQWGSNERIAIVLAYADIQKKLSIAGLCLCIPILVFWVFLRDHYLVSSQSLDDGTVSKNGKSQILYTNDDDIVMKYLKKLVGKKDNKEKVSDSENQVVNP